MCIAGYFIKFSFNDILIETIKYVELPDVTGRTMHLVRLLAGPTLRAHSVENTQRYGIVTVSMFQVAELSN